MVSNGLCWSLFRFQFQKNLRRLISQLYIRDNCHPFKASLLVWVQLPLWISISLALRNLSLDQSGKDAECGPESGPVLDRCGLALDQCELVLVWDLNLCVICAVLQCDLAAGGTLWFPDLTAPDSTWILPVFLGLTNLFIVEVSLLAGV